MKALWSLRGFARPYLSKLLPLIVIMALTASAGAFALFRTQGLFKAMYASFKSSAFAGGAAPMEQAAVAGLIVLGLLLLSSMGEAIAIYGCEWVGQHMLVDLRRALFERLEMLSVRFFEGRQAGELVSRINSDTLILQTVLGMQIAPMVMAPMSAVACICMMLKVSWRLTLLLLILGPSTGWLTAVMSRRVRKYAYAMQQRLADLAVVVDETFSLSRVVKIFGLERRAAQRFAGTAHGVLKAELRSARVRALNVPAIGSLAGLFLCATLLLATYEVIGHRMPPEAPFAFLALAWKAGDSVNKLAKLMLQMQRGEAAAARTQELLNLEPDIQDAPDAIEMPPLRGEVILDHVTFEYVPGLKVLDAINLTIRPGEVVALVGPSGSGKTTLANLIPRLYDVTAGRVLVDGRDVREVTQASLRLQMGIVPQETVLFGTTIRENIGLGKEGSTEEEIVAAARTANAHDFILGLEKGYDTEVGDRGAKLSGGQRQRIAIARAILRDPRILILDEATSSLDRASEVAVHRAIDGLLQGRTALIIAHRLSTVRNADRIIVLSDGRIVEQGTHDELLRTGGLYSSLYQTQDTPTEETREQQSEPTGKPVAE